MATAISDVDSATSAIEKPMPPKSAERSRRETWADWLVHAGIEPDVAAEIAARDLRPRDDILSTLRARGVHVSRADLLNWQGDGLLPYGRRTWVNGEQTTVSPAWTVDVIAYLRQQQDQGRRLSDIAPDLRRFALERFAPELGYENPREIAGVRPVLRAVAHAHERRTGTVVVRVEACLESAGDGSPRLSVRLCDTEGRWMAYGDP